MKAEELVRLVQSRKEWQTLIASVAQILRAQGLKESDLWSDGKSAYKFLAIDYWILEFAQRAIELGLANAPRMRILDIGAGSGMFPFVCRILGHEVIATEVPNLHAEAQVIYPPMTKALQVSIIPNRITAFQRMGLEGQFDLITAFRICFDSDGERRWQQPEWKFLLRDFFGHLRAEGQLAFLFNMESNGIRAYLEPFGAANSIWPNLRFSKQHLELLLK